MVIVQVARRALEKKLMLFPCAFRSLMSEHEVTLVNDSMQEFFVRFRGPEESA